MRTNYKWTFAIGTTSRVPGSRRLHYLILDFDGNYSWTELHRRILPLTSWFIVQKTRHGWHVYTNLICTFRNCCRIAKAVGADSKWIEIAKRRGYFFLADKDKIEFSWPVERMVIYRDSTKSES